MVCVKIVSYTILINGQPGRTFYLSKGIRQGDPLSPYLFLLCAEGLSTLFSKAKREGQIRGIKVARGCQPLNHLFFTDDSILVYRVSLTDWHHI